MMGHLNSFSASGGGNLNKNFAKNTNARGLPGGGMLKLRFDWYITLIMYRPNRSLNIPPGIPQAFDVFSCPGGREFD